MEVLSTFRLTKKGIGARREIIENVGKVPLFTREKAWKTLARLIRIPVIYEERTGGAATDIRQLWYNKDPRYKDYVPIPVANLMKDQEYRIDNLVATKDHYWKFFGKKPWK